MAEHVNLTDPHLHEPKGASGAAVNTVYVSDGLGSGDWVKVSDVSLEGVSSAGLTGQLLISDGTGGFDFLQNENEVYAEAYVAANATATTIGAGNTYQVVGGPPTWVVGHLDHVTWDTNHFVISVAGDYKLSACVCYTGGGTEKVYTFAFGIDSGSGVTPLTHGVMRSKTSGATDIKSVALQAIDPLAAGALVYLLVKDETDTTGLTITDINFILELKEVA
jgi:hypothetical protein